MTDESKQRIVLETLDKINKMLKSDPNALPNAALPETSYIDLVHRLLNLYEQR